MDLMEFTWIFFTSFGSMLSMTKRSLDSLNQGVRCYAVVFDSAVTLANSNISLKNEVVLYYLLKFQVDQDLIEMSDDKIDKCRKSYETIPLSVPRFKKLSR
jgi:hypothetical protein